jgi:hypothetical protein
VDTCALTVYASTTSGYSHTSIRVQGLEGNGLGVVKAIGASAVTSAPLPYSCGVTYRGIIQTVHSDGTHGVGRTAPYKACAGTPWASIRWPPCWPCSRPATSGSLPPAGASHLKRHSRQPAYPQE